jgi:hypothetical protein
MNNLSENNGSHGIACLQVESAKAAENSCRTNGGWSMCFGGGSTTEQVNNRYVVSNNTCDVNGLGGIIAALGECAHLPLGGSLGEVRRQPTGGARLESECGR